MSRSLYYFIVSLFIMSIVYGQLSIVGKVIAQSSTVKTANPSITTAITPKNAPTATPAEIIEKLKQIEQLKEKIATKVAQLRDADKAVLSGTIKKIDKSTLIIATTGTDKDLTFSDDTEVFAITDGKKTDSTTKKLTEGQIVSAFGYYNEDKSTLSAKYIYIKTTTSSRISGKIADIDKSNFTITIHGKEGNILIDIEKYTQSNLFDKKKGKVKIGFSKFKIGDNAQIVATINAKEKDRYYANRILVLSFPSVITPPISVIPDTSNSATVSATKPLTPTKSSAVSPTKATSSPTPTIKL